MQKRCHHCGTQKDLVDFNKNAANYDGFDTCCRTCTSEIRKSVEFKNRAAQRKKWARNMMKSIKPKPNDY